MSKIELDKYYTSPELAKYVVDKTKEIIGEDNITEYIEPSAGAGVFLDYLDKPYLAYDIEPEDDRIIKQDFLELDIEYKKGRCIIGNPPYGVGNTQSVQFYKKSITISDSISFIQPISQLNNNMQMYEFNLIHSEDLGLQTYTDRELHCCFNIYVRPAGGILGSKPNYKLKDVVLKQSRKRNGVVPGNIDIKDYDIAVCIRGNGSAGKVCNSLNDYNDIILVKCINEDLRDEVIESMKNIRSFFKSSISSLNINTWQVYKYLKEQIPELK